MSAGPARPRVIDFESFCIPEQWAAMRFDWNDEAGKWSFYLDREIPYVIGFNVRKPLTSLLERNGLDFSAVKHWVLHTGGGAVIDSVKLSLGLEEHDVRHTRSVLRDYGLPDVEADDIGDVSVDIEAPLPGSGAPVEAHGCPLVGDAEASKSTTRGVPDGVPVRRRSRRGRSARPRPLHRRRDC